MARSVMVIGSFRQSWSYCIACNCLQRRGTTVARCSYIPTDKLHSDDQYMERLFRLISKSSAVFCNFSHFWVIILIGNHTQRLRIFKNNLECIRESVTTSTSIIFEGIPCPMPFVLGMWLLTMFLRAVSRHALRLLQRPWTYILAKGGMHEL